MADSDVSKLSLAAGQELASHRAAAHQHTRFSQASFLAFLFWLTLRGFFTDQCPIRGDRLSEKISFFYMFIDRFVVRFKNYLHLTATFLGEQMFF